jgi:hypothetical protein
MILFYIPQEQYLNQDTLFLDPKVCGNSVTPVPQLPASAILLLSVGT